jgi:hypothetical protein
MAAIDAKYRLKKEFEELRILSIGTGGSHTSYSMKKSFCNKYFGWGFLTRWRRQQLVAMILNLQSQSANNMLGLLLDKNLVLRIDCESNIALDDPSMQDDLITRADKDFINNSLRIKRFLQER